MWVEQILTVTHGSPVCGRGEDTGLLQSWAKGSVRNLEKLGEVSAPAEKAAVQKAGNDIQLSLLHFPGPSSTLGRPSADCY